MRKTHTPSRTPPNDAGGAERAAAPARRHELRDRDLRITAKPPGAGEAAPTSYFAGSSAPALLSREEEHQLASQLVVARERIQQLLRGAPELVATTLPTDERGVGNPIEDFRERETQLVYEAARRAANGSARDAHALGFRTLTCLREFVSALACALDEYRALRDRMIEANLRLVLSLARRYRRSGVPFFDLAQEGTLGLIRAVEKYDPVRDVRFGTYAVWWIWQQIGRAGDQHSALIRTPMHWNQLRRKLGRAVQRLESSGVRLERGHIAEASGVDEQRVEVLSQPFLCLSLASPVGDTDDRPLEDTIASDVRGPERIAVAADLGLQLEKALEVLPEREANVLRMRFGMAGGESFTLEEIGQRYGLSRERVRQIEARALKLLLPICEKQGLREYVGGP